MRSGLSAVSSCDRRFLLFAFFLSHWDNQIESLGSLRMEKTNDEAFVFYGPVLAVVPNFSKFLNPLSLGVRY